jgi:signal transduction histidine kinase
MDTSSASRNAIVSVATLAERIAARRQTHVLVLKTDDFARASWLHGREQAAELEIRAAQRFEELGRALVRADDLLVHSFGSDVFAVALCGERAVESAEHDVKRALAGIERTFLERMPVTFVSSWTQLRPENDVVRVLESAAERGRRRRDRRAYAELVHDLATPVSAITGSLSAVIDGGLDRERERRFLQSALDEALRIGRMLREFLAAERLESELPAPSTDLAHVVARGFDAVQALAFERNMTLRVCSDCDEPLVTPLDRDVAISLVVNLAANAIKHGHPGGRVHGRIRRVSGACEISIDDDGPGIDEADRERIFEFGGRGSAPIAPGWGIGLAQVRRIVREHGGDVCAQRSPLGGARFVVRLPSDDLDARDRTALGESA